MLAGASVGFVERVASVPWTVILVVAITAVTAPRVFPGFWVVFTGVFAILALGPFIRVGGLLTYIPTPWALLRYVPVVGAARMPTRFSIIVMLGAAMLLAYALRERRTCASRPGLFAAIVTAVLLFELLPAPRVLHSARAPSVFHLIAEDPRDVRVLNLPFGLRDGMSSYGDINAAAPYYQTVHQKPILGAYLSRLPLEDVRAYRALPVTSALLALSEGRTLSDGDRVAASRNAREMASELRVGYVVADTSRTTAELIDFAREAFALEYVAADGDFVLYRAPPAGQRYNRPPVHPN
jgi:hypothetical protein